MITRIRQHAEPLKHLVVGPVFLISPVFLMASYLWCADHWFRWNTRTDIAALVIVMLLGAVGIYLLPISRFARGLIILPYVVFVGWLMISWAIVWRGGL
jgi:hypothetical protein